MAVQLCAIPHESKEAIPYRFERKYYLPPGKVEMAYGLLRQICRVDSEHPSDQVNSLYFDTVDLDQYERSCWGDFSKDKIRIRWYGEEENLRGMQTVFVEVKSKRGFASTKHRYPLQVPAEYLRTGGLRDGIVPRTALLNVLAGFGYFPKGLLQPLIKISYQRYRFVDTVTSQRVSLDCHICSTMITPLWGNGEKELELPGAVIEIKGESLELPLTLAQIRLLEVDWSSFSKYAICLSAHAERPGALSRLTPAGRILWDQERRNL